MGFLSRLFGGDDDKAAKWQREDNREMLDFIKKQSALSRRDAIPRYDQAQAVRRLGYDEALKLLGKSIPQQARLLREGNINQQGTFAGGSNMYADALLGRSVNANDLVREPLEVDTGFLENVQLPEAPVDETFVADTGQIPEYSNPIFDDSEEVRNAYSLGASPMASANDLAAFNLGVADLNYDGVISNDEFRNWSGYQNWLAQNPNHPRGANRLGSQPGSRFTGEYIDGVPQYVMPIDQNSSGNSRRLQNYLGGVV